MRNQPPTPTNHTSSAMFQMLDSDYESSLEEQSSIEDSRFLESTHERAAGHRRRPTLQSLPEGDASDNETTFRSETTFQTTGQPNPLSLEQTKHVSNLAPVPIRCTSGAVSCLSPSSHHEMNPNILQDASDANLYEDSYKRLEQADHEHIAAWAIHVALIGFCLLVLVAVLLSFLVISKYGFVTMCAMLMIILFFVFLMYFVDKTILKENKKLKPIRQKIVNVVQAAQQAVVEEYKLFQIDWNEHYLITNGESEDSADHETDEEQPSPGTPAKNKKQSAVFHMIKPLLRIRRKLFRRKRGNKQQESSNTEEYEPPVTKHQLMVV